MHTSRPRFFASALAALAACVLAPRAGAFEPPSIGPTCDPPCGPCEQCQEGPLVCDGGAEPLAECPPDYEGEGCGGELNPPIPICHQTSVCVTSDVYACSTEQDPETTPQDDCGASPFVPSQNGIWCDPTHCDPSAEGWLSAYLPYADPMSWSPQTGGIWRPRWCFEAQFGPGGTPPQCVGEVAAGPVTVPDGPAPELQSASEAFEDMCATALEHGRACYGGELLCWSDPSLTRAQSCVNCDLVTGVCDRVDVVDPHLHPDSEDEEPELIDVIVDAITGGDPYGTERVKGDHEDSADEGDPAEEQADTPDWPEWYLGILKQKARERPSKPRPEGALNRKELAGDPVVLLSGELLYTDADLSFERSPMALAMTRQYRSRGQYAGRLGRNWEHAYEERLRPITWAADRDHRMPAFCFADFPLINCIVHYRADAGMDLYLYDAQRRAFVSESGNFGTITAAMALDGAGAPTGHLRYRHRTPTGLVTEFTKRGRMLRKVDPVGNALRFIYSGALLVRVEDQQGRFLQLDYGEELGLLETVTDHLGRRVEYSYNLHVDGHSGLPDTTSGRYRLSKRALTFIDAERARNGGSELPPAGTSELVDLQLRMTQGVEHPPLSRALATLRQVDIYGAPEGCDPGSEDLDCRWETHPETNLPIWVCEPTGEGCEPEALDPPISVRYAYSEVPESWAFRKALVAWADAHSVPPAPADSLCEDQRQQDLAVEAVRAYMALFPKLTRVERRLSGAERVAGHAVRCDADACWLTELETAYDWDLGSRTLGFVWAQRYGASEDLYSPTPMPIDAATAGAAGFSRPTPEHWDAFQTALPLFAFSYELDPVLALGSGGVETVDYTDIWSEIALAGLEVADTRCAQLQEEFPRTLSERVTMHFDHDGDLTTPRHQLYLVGARQQRRDAGRKVCAVVTTGDRSGVQTHYALNYMGRSLITLRVTTDGMQRTVVEYNADERPTRVTRRDGQVTENLYESDLVADIRTANPFALGNLREVRRYPGAPTTPPGVPPEALGERSDVLVTSFTYEPLTNGVRTITDPMGATTELLYEYMESKEALAAATTYLTDEERGFGVHPSAFAEISFEASGDVNGDGCEGNGQGCAYARPLVIRVRAPWHEASDGSLARREATMAYNGFGQPISVVSRGQRVDYSYHPRLLDPGQPLQPCYDSDCVGRSVPALPGPLGDSGVEGGSPREILALIDQSASASTLGQPEIQVLSQRFDVGPDGEVVRIRTPDASEGQVDIEHAFDALWRQIETRTPDGAVYRRIYDGAGRLVVSEAEGPGVEPERTRTFRDALGASIATCVEFHLGACEAPLHALIAARAAGDEGFALRTIRRDGEGRTVEQVGPELEASAVFYDGLGRAILVRSYDAAEPSTNLLALRTTYDSYGRVASQARATVDDEIAQAFGYDGYGARTSAMSSDGVVTVVELDDRGAPLATSVLDGEGLTYLRTAIERDPAGMELAKTLTWPLVPGDPSAGELSRTTTFARDEQGRVIRITHPDGRSQRTTYASDGATAKVEDNLGNVLLHYRDPLAHTTRVRRVHKAAGIASEVWTRSDWAGRPVEQQVSRAGEVYGLETSYDAFGRPVHSQDDGGAEVAWSYDRATRLLRTEQAREADGVFDVLVDTYGDRSGRKSRVLDAEGGELRWTYDALGRIVAHQAPAATGGARRWSYTFDGLGRPTGKFDDEGGWQVLTYGAGTDRVEKLLTPDAKQSYGYDGLGRTTSTSRVQGGVRVDTEVALDGAGWPLSELLTIDDGVEVASYETSWTRDAIGRPQVRQAPSGHATSWKYDELGRVLSLRHDGDQTLITTPQWQGPWLSAQTTTIGKQPWFTRAVQRDGGGRVFAIDLSTPVGPLVQQSIWYDARDRVAGEWLGMGSPPGQETSRLWAPSYDNLGMLAGLERGFDVLHPAPGTVATDFEGGLGKLAHEALSYTRALRDTLLTESDDGTTRWSGLRYDAAPGMKVVDDALGEGPEVLKWGEEDRLWAAGPRTFTWTDRGELAAVYQGKVPVEQRYYDALGRIVRIATAEGTRDLAYAGGQILEEHSECGFREWLHGVDGAPSAYRVEWDKACTSESPGLFDLSEDHAGAYDGAWLGVATERRGDAVAVFDAAGTLVESSEFGAYGRRHLRDVDGRECTSSTSEPCASSYGNPLGYAGQRLSAASGLYAMGARQYDPHLRQFLSRDPAGYVDSFDPYVYAAGDPINFVDPTGFEAQTTRSSTNPEKEAFQTLADWQTGHPADEAIDAFCHASRLCGPNRYTGAEIRMLGHGWTHVRAPDDPGPLAMLGFVAAVYVDKAADEVDFAVDYVANIGAAFGTGGIGWLVNGGFFDVTDIPNFVPNDEDLQGGFQRAALYIDIVSAVPGVIRLAKHVVQNPGSTWRWLTGRGGDAPPTSAADGPPSRTAGGGGGGASGGVPAPPGGANQPAPPPPLNLEHFTQCGGQSNCGRVAVETWLHRVNHTGPWEVARWTSATRQLTTSLSFALRQHGYLNYIAAPFQTMRSLYDAIVGSGRPVIANVFTGGGHFVVVDTFTHHQGRWWVHISDPAAPTGYWEPVESFGRRFSGWAVVPWAETQ